MPISRETALDNMYRVMRDILPDVMPDTDPVSGSLFNSIVKTLSTSAAEDYINLVDFYDNINILKAVSGIGEWESVLGLSTRTDLSLTNRQSRIFARMSGKPCTITTMKNIIRSYLGSDDFQIFEYWTLNDPASAFRYKIFITRSDVQAYDEESLQLDLLRIQPAHCGDIVEIVDSWDVASDDFSFTESVSATNYQFFVIGSSLIGGPDLIGPNI